MRMRKLFFFRLATFVTGIVGVSLHWFNELSLVYIFVMWLLVAAYVDELAKAEKKLKKCEEKEERF